MSCTVENNAVRTAMFIKNLACIDVDQDFGLCTQATEYLDKAKVELVVCQSKEGSTNWVGRLYDRMIRAILER
ncbi:MAG: hypothetical protein NT099_06655 [Candidatus Saganbacteria bacterium]|nr:hypothetical protein [Candidatus Saganbacteria bacterium]